MPAQQRRRRHEKRAPGGTAQHPGEGDEQDSIDKLKIRPVNLAAQHRDLVPQHQDLDTQHQDDKLEGASQREAGKGPQHCR